MNTTYRYSILAMVAFAACSSGEATEAPEISTVETSRGDLEITVEASGSIEPVRTVEVKSLASGEITKLHADIGDRVEPGQLLAEVDPRDVRTSYQQAEADLAVAEARMEISRTSLERSERLFEAGVITEQELENAKLDYTNNQAQFTRSQSSFDLAELRLNDVTIRAPLAGTILAKNVEEGSVIQSASGNVSGGSVLFTMAALEAMQVRTLIDETDMGRIRAGMTATIGVEAYKEESFQGTVLKIEPQAVVQSNVVLFPVIITLDNRRGLLKPGMNAEVVMTIDQARDVMLVPNTAVTMLEDLMPAAMALGIDPETIDESQFQSSGRGVAARGGQRGAGGAAAGGGQRGEGGAAAGAGAGAGNAAEGGAAGAAAGGAPDMAALREQVASGAISRDSITALMRARGGGRGAGAGTGTMQVDGGTEIQTRQAVVFVMNAAGVPAPQLVTIGLSDWDQTQVVSGLEGTEVLAVVGAAQLRANQDEFLDRMRSRGGSSPFGR